MKTVWISKGRLLRGRVLSLVTLCAVCGLMLPVVSVLPVCQLSHVSPLSPVSPVPFVPFVPFAASAAELTYPTDYLSALRQYQSARNLYQRHRQIFQSNINTQGSLNVSVESSLKLGNKPNFKMPFIDLPDDCPFLDVAHRDYEITQMEESLAQLIPALFASRDKISRGEYRATWQDLMQRSLNVEKAVASLNHDLAVLSASNSRKITEMIHAADRDGIQSEYQSTYGIFNATNRVENELFRRADKHGQIALSLKSMLLASPPAAVTDPVSAYGATGDGAQSGASVPVPIDPQFSGQDIQAQQRQLDSEYQEVMRLYQVLSSMGRVP